MRQEAAKIADTQKPVEELIAHVCEGETSLEVGKEYELVIDVQHRNLVMRNHSATHLLQAALINVLGDHIKQAGSMNSASRLRFDFTHPKAMTKKELQKVEDLVNQQIQTGLPVSAEHMSMTAAQEKGAMALFGEKYGDDVRVLSMGDFSLELCGGTHVPNTADIGLFVINFETSLSSGIRRIEAQTSVSAFRHLKERSEVLGQVERSLSSKGEAIIEKIESLQGEVKSKTKEIAALKDKLQAQASKDLFNEVKDIGKGFGLVLVDLENGNPKDFRKLSDKFVDQNKKDVLLLATVANDKLNYLLRTHKENKNIDCSKVIRNSQEVVNGKGGGRPDMAQGSGDKSGKAVFFQKIEENLQEL